MFAAGFALPSQVNPVLDVPIGEPLHKVVRFMAKIVANDFGGLLILALYGYGVSGAKVARSMFEASVNAAYLAKHPKCVDDYIELSRRREKEVLRPDEARVRPALNLQQRHDRT